MSKSKYVTFSAEKMQKLMQIGLELSSQKELQALLRVLLDSALEVTGAEGASVYLIEQKRARSFENVITLTKKPFLRFLRSTNRRSGQTERSGIFEVSAESIAGYTALSQEILNIEDCYEISETEPYRFNSTYDKQFGYKTKSMLTVPMVNSEGKVRGIIQLVNKLTSKGLEKLESKKVIDIKEVISFDEQDEEVLRIFASHAGVAIENSQLSQSIENLFESFVRASIKAIESRDPTTSGHSDRVAMMTVELALSTHKLGEGPYKNMQFSEEQIREIRYAALLHDFGKIGVSENVLHKKKKLFDRDLNGILVRLDAISDREEKILWRDLCEQMMAALNGKNKGFDPEVALQQIMVQLQTTKDQLRTLRRHIISANEPQILSSDLNIDQLIEKIEHSNDMLKQPILTKTEIKSLAIPRGSLSEDQRREIESHVDHTYEFLKQIAWTENLSDVAEIAHCHHEKMDGTGYPRKIKGSRIPLQARMMTIADIYDALTAFDRPYKKSLPPSRALEILVKEARSGKIDGHLLKIFIEAGVFHKATLGAQQARFGS